MSTTILLQPLPKLLLHPSSSSLHPPPHPPVQHIDDTAEEGRGEGGEAMVEAGIPKAVEEELMEGRREEERERGLG